jgi:hypothetical protein
VCVAACTLVADANPGGRHVALVEECCLDRSVASHKVELFHARHKHVDVMRIDGLLPHGNGPIVKRAS